MSAPAVRVNWFGSLRELRSPAGHPPVLLGLDAPIGLADLLMRLDLPRRLVQLVMVNNRAVSPDVVIRQGDRVALFPREYPFFVDWNDFRLRGNDIGGEAEAVDEQ